MSKQPNSEEILAYITERLASIEARPLMYGGTLLGVECIWMQLKEVQHFASGLECDMHKAYGKVAAKYKCGSWVLSGKVAEELGETREASDELIRRLREVEKVAIASELR